MKKSCIFKYVQNYFRCVGYLVFPNFRRLIEEDLPFGQYVSSLDCLTLRHYLNLNKDFQCVLNYDVYKNEKIYEFSM